LESLSVQKQIFLRTIKRSINIPSLINISVNRYWFKKIIWLLPVSLSG